MLTVEDIKKVVRDTDFGFYGLRADDGVCYDVGDIANSSHQLYQDPVYDDDDNLIYPYIEDGPYKGFYDAGELDGTCTIGFDPDDEGFIAKAIDSVKAYFGDCVHILGGDYARVGEDAGELIIKGAEVLALYDR